MFVKILTNAIKYCRMTSLIFKGVIIMTKEKIIAARIDKIIQILDELQDNEINQFISIQRNQALILKKINKLQEYNEIDDMNQSIFAKKLQEIEQKI